MPLFDDLNQPQDNKLTDQYQDILKKYSDYLKPTSPVDEILQEPITSPPASPTPPPVVSPPSINPPPPALSDIMDVPPTSVPPAEPLPPQSVPEVSQELAASRPDSGNFYKIFFYLTLVIFLIVVGLLAYNYLKNSSPKTVDLVPTSTPATPTISPGCDLNDQKYPVGGSFPAADGCNICTCGEDLLFTCTETICPATPSTTSGKKPTPTVTKTATTSADFTTWKTYTNNEYNFSLKYPKEWTVSPMSSATPFLYLQNTDKSFRLDLSYLKEEKGVVNPITKTESLFDSKTYQKLDINGIEVFWKENVTGDDGTIYTDYYYKISTGKYVQIILPTRSAPPEGKAQLPSDIKTAKEIINTFYLTKKED